MKPPTKWYLARVGLLTGLLGVGAGFLLFHTPASPQLRVPGARTLRVECRGYEARSDGDRIPLSGQAPCTATAGFDDGSSAKGTLAVTLSASCTRDGEELRCASWSP